MNATAGLIPIALNLGILGDNGGGTQTIALGAGSGAIGFVATTCPSTDQRGFLRPGTGACDAGAYQSGYTGVRTLRIVGMPANITVIATSSGAGVAATYAAPTAISDSGATVPATINCSPASGSTFATGTTTVTCTVTASGFANSPLSATFTVTVVDPLLVLVGMPGGPGGTATSANGVVINYTPPTAINNAGATVPATISCSPASGSIFAIGTTTVTCTATASGYANSPLSGTFEVSVDTGVPAITAVTPNSGTAGSAASTITIAGTGFVTGDVAYLYTVSTGVATPLTTHVTSLTQLTADVPANLALSDTLITVNDSSNSRRKSGHWLWPVTSSGAALTGVPSSATAHPTPRPEAAGRPPWKRDYRWLRHWHPGCRPVRREPGGDAERRQRRLLRRPGGTGVLGHCG